MPANELKPCPFCGESAALRAKLATPVRLPHKNTGWDRDDGEDCWNNAIDACAKELRAAGFTVEGDE